MLKQRTARNTRSRKSLALRRLMRRMAGFLNADMFARLSFLEGAAGVPAGSWLQQGTRGFGDAMNTFPNAHGEWTAAGNQGLYDTAFNAAVQASGKGKLVDPEDVLQNLIKGSNDPGGSMHSKLFYSIGAHFGKELVASGVLRPRSRDVQRVIFSRIRRAIIDEARKYERKKRKLSEIALRQRWEVETYDRETRFNIMMNLVQRPGGIGERFREMIREKMETDLKKNRKQEVFLKFFDEIIKPEYQSVGKLDKPGAAKKALARGFERARAALMEEGFSQQQLTNYLGAGARKFIEFLEPIAEDPKMKAVIEEISDEADVMGIGFRHLASEVNKRLYLDLVRLAAVESRWRPALRPLLRLATYKPAGQQSGTLELRAAAMRTAYHTRDRELRAALVRTMLKREARFSSKFLDWTSGRTFRRGDSDDEVGFHRLSPDQQKDELKKWKLQERAEREKLRPAGLCKETELTAERFDTLEPGSLLWNPANPQVFYKVTDKGGPQKGDAFVQLIEVCRDDPEDVSGFGESRTLHRSTIDGIGVHIVPVEEDEQEAVVTPSKKLLELALPENVEGSEDRFEIETMTVAEAEEMLDRLDRILAKPRGKETKEALQAGYTLEGLQGLRDELADLLAT